MGALCMFTTLRNPRGAARSAGRRRSPGRNRVAPRDEVEGSVQGRAETQSRGVVLVVCGFPGSLEEGGAAQVGHGFGAVSVGRLREVARAGWSVETFHFDVRGAGAVRVPARAYLLQPHRPAALRESTRFDRR